MSLLFLASNLLERVGVKRRLTLTPTALVESPPSETPREIRDRLRQAIRDRGADPLEIESIPGNCDQQVATQIADYNSWLDKQVR